MAHTLRRNTNHQGKHKMQKTIDGKAPVPTRGNAKVTYQAIAEYGDWVSVKWLYTTIDRSSFHSVKSTTGRQLKFYEQVDNAINYLFHSGRLNRRQRGNDYEVRIASFDHFDAFQKSMASRDRSGGNVLKQYSEAAVQKEDRQFLLEKIFDYTPEKEPSELPTAVDEARTSGFIRGAIFGVIASITVAVISAAIIIS